MIILAIDLGKARTGVAICDKSEILASPVEVIDSYNREKLLAKLCDIVKERKVELLVVGNPVNMDSSSGESSTNAKLFAQELSNLTGLEHVMRDERLTTVSAHGYLNQTNTRGKKRKEIVDAVSAVIILEDYIKFRKN